MKKILLIFYSTILLSGTGSSKPNSNDPEFMSAVAAANIYFQDTLHSSRLNKFLVSDIIMNSNRQIDAIQLTSIAKPCKKYWFKASREHINHDIFTRVVAISAEDFFRLKIIEPQVKSQSYGTLE